MVDTTFDGLARTRTVSNPHRSASASTDGTATTAYDVLGRPVLVTEQDGSTVQTAYDQTCKTLTNTLGTTVTDEAGHQRRTCTDGLGRLVEVDEPSSTGLTTPLVTLYSYNVRGDLLCVVQKGTDTTAFTTCASAPLTWRPRSFTYDTLSRLLSASNPESGTISYTYDPNSNVVTKTAPSPNQPSTGTSTVVTTYTYDALNRLTGKSYADSYSANNATNQQTLPVLYGYDGVAPTGCTKAPPVLPDSYPIGRRTSMCDASGSTSWNHDQMGRTLIDSRFIGSVTPAKRIAYGFNFDGSQSDLTTAPMKYLVYQVGGAGRTLSVEDTVDSINFVTNATYAPPGELQSFTDGAAINGAAAYNSRLQPLQLFYGTNTPPAITSMTASCPSTVGNIMNKTYGFGLGTTDNGNVLSITNCRDTTRTQTFTYDVLNRIASAQSSGSQWGETFTIDNWGNLTNETQITGKTNHEGLNTTAGTNNQLAGFGYDPAGNMTSNTALGATYVYDDENRLIWTSGDRYVYDGDGKRVERCVAATSTTACPTSGTNGTLYWRGTGSDTQDETDLSGNPVEQYIFFNGARIARRDVTSTGTTIAIHYYFSDHLGSHSVIENATGTATEQDIDYYPYGGVENDYCTACVAQHYKFTGKERDSESGLDNFGARYDTSSLGRFMTPDWAVKPITVPYAKFGNPQSLNLYSYVVNNPLTLVDDDGHDIIYAPGLQNAQVVKDSVQAILANPHTSASLSGYVGPNSPNLTIKSGDLSAGDTRTVNADGSVTTTIVQGDMQPFIETGSGSSTFDGVTTTSAPETKLTDATITIDNRTSKGDVPGVMVHESVHAGEANANPAQFAKDSKAEKSLPHDQRPQEQRANAAQQAYTKEIKQAVKQIEKDRKQENQ